MTPLLPLALILSIHPTTINPAHATNPFTERSTTPMATQSSGGHPPIYHGPQRATSTDRVGMSAGHPVITAQHGYPAIHTNRLAAMAPTTPTEHTTRPR